MPTALTDESTRNGLKERLTKALDGNPYLSRRYRVDVTEYEGHVTLAGKVGSYFQKQMAQELLRSVDGVRQINNCLEVDWS